MSGNTFTVTLKAKYPDKAASTYYDIEKCSKAAKWEKASGSLK